MIGRRTAALLLLAGCGPLSSPPAGGWASLPPDATQGAGDPTVAAILNAAAVFGNPGSVAGNPVGAARAVAQYEYLATEIPTGPRWQSFQPVVSVQLAKGRRALRETLGIAQDAPTQGIIDSMYAAGRALVMGDRPAAVNILSAPFYRPGGEALLARLAALPLIQDVNVATTMTEAAYLRMMRDGYSRPGGART